MPREARRTLRNGHDDLHGNAPDQSQAVLLLIDVINDLSFPDNQDLVRRSVALAEVDRQTEEAMQEVGHSSNLRQRQSRSMAFRSLRRVASLPGCAIARLRNDEATRS